MNIEYILGFLVGVIVVLLGLTIKQIYTNLYDHVVSLRAERKELLERTRELTAHFYATQEDVNSYYEWKKSRQ
jgi:hypothetical protein